MLNDDLIIHLFNWFGLIWETGLKLWSNQIIIPILVLILVARRDVGGEIPSH